MKTSDGIQNKKEAAAVLDEMVNSWTKIEKTEEGFENRSPANMKEIRRSRKLLKRCSDLMKYQVDAQLKEHYDELFGVVQITEMRIGDFKQRLSRRIGVSALVAGFVILMFLFTPGPDITPAFKWDAADWTIATDTALNAGDLGDIGTLYDKVAPQNKILAAQPGYKLHKGEQVIPLCSDFNGRWVQVRTQNGMIGFIEPVTLTGGRRIVIVGENVQLFSEGLRKGRSYALPVGMKAQFIEERSVPDFAGNPQRVPFIRTDDGRVGYVESYQFAFLLSTSLPQRTPGFIITTTADNVKRRMIGHTLADIRKMYGPADSYMPGPGGTMQAYFKGLNVLENGAVKESSLIKFDRNGLATGLEHIGRLETPMLARLPLIEQYAALEPQRIIQPSYYKDLDSEWYSRIKDRMTGYHWSTKVLYYVISFSLIVICVVGFASIPRILIDPVMLIIATQRSLNNRWVLRINTALLALVYFVFVMQVCLMSNSLANALCYTAPAFYIFFRRYRKYLEYKRCPHCNALESAIDAGTRYDHSVKVMVHDGYQDVYRGNIGRVAIYDRYEKKREKIELHFADQRICAACRKNWEVDRVE